jgi:hypothetical protein
LGKTVPAYRIALEYEIARWKGFRKALKTAEEQEAFDELMDMCRNNVAASGNACNPIIFEPMTMSILLAQQKRLQTLEKKKLTPPNRAAKKQPRTRQSTSNK